MLHDIIVGWERPRQTASVLVVGAHPFVTAKLVVIVQHGGFGSDPAANATSALNPLFHNKDIIGLLKNCVIRERMFGMDVI